MPGALVAHHQVVATRVHHDLDRDAAACGREVDRVVDQVGERALEQERVARDHRVGLAGQHLERDAARQRRRRCARRDLGGDRAQRDRLGAIDALPRLERGQLHHAVDQLLDALRLARDVGDKARTVGVAHRLLQQLGRAADRRQRALHLVRHRLHIVGDVVAAGERIAHLVVGRAERAERAAAEARQREAALGAHVAHVVAR